MRKTSKETTRATKKQQDRKEKVPLGTRSPMIGGAVKYKEAVKRKDAEKRKK